MLKVYSEIWNDFQFRAPNYLDGHLEPHKFDLVKWVDCEPREVLDMDTGKRKMMDRYCFSVGHLIWNPKESGFEFESVGLRYLEERVDGLEDYILSFCKDWELKLLNGERCEKLFSYNRTGYDGGLNKGGNCMEINNELYSAFKKAVVGGRKTGFFSYTPNKEVSDKNTVFYHFPYGMIEFRDAGLTYHNDYEKAASFKDVLHFGYGVSLYRFLEENEADVWLKDFKNDIKDVKNQKEELLWYSPEEIFHLNIIKRFRFDNDLHAYPYLMGDTCTMDFPNLDALPGVIEQIIQTPIENMTKITIREDENHCLYRTFETLGEDTGNDTYMILRETYRQKLKSHMIENTSYQLIVSLYNEETVPTKAENTLVITHLKENDLLILKESVDEFLSNAFEAENARIEEIKEYVLLPGYWMEEKEFLEENIERWSDSHPEYSKRSMLPKLIKAYNNGDTQVIKLTNKEYAELKGWFFSIKSNDEKVERLVQCYLELQPDHECYEIYSKTKGMSAQGKMEYIMHIYHIKTEEKFYDFVNELRKHKYGY